MSGTITIPKLMIGTATLAICGSLAIGMSSEAPLVLYPITPSLPPGLYVRTFAAPTVGMIAAFRVPEVAQRYKSSVGEDVHHGFLFMKPIIAGPRDHVCNRFQEGLFINGAWVASMSARDRSGGMLPIWSGCRWLLEKEFFTLSTHTSSSFDGRHYGPTKADDIRGVYHALSSLELISDG